MQAVLRLSRIFKSNSCIELLEDGYALQTVKHGTRQYSSWKEPLAPPCSRVVVTGLGLVSPLGLGWEANWRYLLTGKSAIRSLEPGHLPESHRHVLPLLPSRVAGVVNNEEFGKFYQRDLDARRSGRFVAFARCAADEALKMAGYQAQSEAQKNRSGVCIGAAMSSVSEVAATGQLVMQGQLRRVGPFFVPKVLSNMAAGMVSLDHSFRGPHSSPSTACATGLHAIGEAYRQVQRGDADVMVAGSAESCIDAISMNGFCRMKALSTTHNEDPAGASRPFDRNRSGFVMAEGAGMLVLESLEHAQARGAEILAEIRGFGTSGDAHHITQPCPLGSGAKLAMTCALLRSGLTHHDVHYINAHATSTPQGDAIEQQAIAQMFGHRAAGGHNLVVSSTKGATGHLLGAAGAVEAAFTVLAVNKRLCPPPANLQQPDDEHLGCLLMGTEPHSLPENAAALCNSFGFGGTNASLLITSSL